MVQLVVYPSFLYCAKHDLIAWHKKYTHRIGYIVGPLMLAQLGFSIYVVSIVPSGNQIVRLLLISTIWILTIIQFIPIHNNISKSKTTQEELQALVLKNWSRTVLWTLVFLLNILHY